TSTEKEKIDRMGASWVQVGLNKEKILDTGYGHSGILWNEIADYLARQ
ncbi:35071_t:CDS:2, partial [Gigaspora margarita]